jgi:L-lactate dehydrogenase
MLIGVVGAGQVGGVSSLALIGRGVCRNLVLIDSDPTAAAGLALDLRYAAPLTPVVDIRAGGYPDLAGAALVILAAGVNEQAGGATDRADPQGRLRLAAANARIYAEVVPQVVQAAPEAVLMVVTDPPGPLAHIARRLAGHPRVFATGTFLDSLRFRVHLAERLHVQPADVDAVVIGEHGTSEVLLWSSATVAGRPALDVLAAKCPAPEQARSEVEDDVRYANIAIIEGTGASRYGIAAVVARLAAAVLRDERTVFPVGVYHPGYGTTFSMPCVLGRDGVERIVEPPMTDAERAALDNSAAILRAAVARCEEAIAVDTTGPVAV